MVNSGREEPSDSRSESEEVEYGEIKPIGEPVKITGTGNQQILHYKAFLSDDQHYNLEDPVLLAPCEAPKAHVVFIKDIYRDTDGSLLIEVQPFYRPEEVEKEGGGYLKACDIRELFYSFDREVCEAETVMHKCVVHFILMGMQLPDRKVNPGFIVQKVYDVVNKRLRNLNDRDFDDDKKQEIERLVRKTRSRLGDLLDVESREQVTELPKKNEIPPPNVSRSGPTTSADGHLKKTLGSSNALDYHDILATYDALTGDILRDKWKEKLLEAVKHVCEHVVSEDEEIYDMNTANRSKQVDNYVPRQWPDFAVRAAHALETVSHFHHPETQKYNQKMRSLVFNLQKNPILAYRLIDEKLTPSRILNMTPNELKEAFTLEETGTEDSDDKAEYMQMTNARCSRCNEFEVGLRDIIRAGRDDRYQLECMECGYSWYASRDETSIEIVKPSSAKDCRHHLPPPNLKKWRKNLTRPHESDEAAS